MPPSLRSTEPSHEIALASIAQHSAGDDEIRIIIQSLRALMQEVDLHSRRLKKNYDLTVSQILCLYEVHDKGPQTSISLARSLHVTPSSLVNIIDKLEEKKLIARTRDLEDRRAIHITITPDGQRFVKEEPHLLHNRIDKHLRNLPTDEKSALAAALRKLTASMANT